MVFDNAFVNSHGQAIARTKPSVSNKSPTTSITTTSTFGQLVPQTSLTFQHPNLPALSRLQDMKKHDVFICHASEDKAAVVRPLAEALEEAKVSRWVDEGQIKWGDSIGTKINEGLRNSEYVIVVVSDVFVSKQWPQAELNASFNREVSDGKTHVLPLFVGDRDELIRQLPLLADKRGLDWTGDPSHVVRELQGILGQASSQPAVSPSPKFTPKIPSVPKPITDLDRDRFLKSAYQTILEYFEAGAQAIVNSKDDHMHAELEKLSGTGFSCQIYVDGNKKNFCQIWIDNDFGRYSHIYYSTSPHAIGGSSKSFNEMISVDESSGELRLKESMGNMFGKRNEAATPEQIAECLWSRFVG